MSGGGKRDPSAGLSSEALLKQYAEYREGAASGAAAAAAAGAAAAADKQQMLQRMLPKFNPEASCVEELFCLENVIPLQLLNDGSAHTGTPAAPLLQLLQQQPHQQQQQAAAWGPFILAAAKHAAAHRQTATNHHLSGQLDAPQLARLLKLLKFLCLLLMKQRRGFANQKDVAKQLRVGDEEPSASVVAWVQSEFLVKTTEGHYSMPKECQTKILATILWSCCALSSDFKFDFSLLLEEEFGGQKSANFKACASLLGLKPSRSNSAEYQLSHPSPLVQLEETPEFMKTLEIVFQDKKKR